MYDTFGSPFTKTLALQRKEKEGERERVREGREGKEEREVSIVHNSN